MFVMTDANINEISKMDLDIIRNPQVGGIVYFQGVVRNHNEGKRVTSLEYTSYTPMAVKVGTQIVERAKKKFEVEDIYCAHRIGHLGINDTAVWVIATSHHRGEAFAATQYVIDAVKTEAPIWKKEHYLNEEAEWVACHGCAKHSNRRSGND